MLSGFGQVRNRHERGPGGEPSLLPAMSRRDKYPPKARRYREVHPASLAYLETAISRGYRAGSRTTISVLAGSSFDLIS